MKSYLRGEMKTPGGKLVAVEFRVDADQLRDISITGDFFLYPEEALPLLAASLEGVPVTSSEAEISRKVDELLVEKQDISLIGTSPNAIATAISRALAAAKSD